MSDMRSIGTALFLSLALSACERDMRDMYDQAKPHPDALTTRFDDGRDARPQPEGTVSHASGVIASASSGRVADSATPLTPRGVLERGRDRYDIFCAPCHSPLGDGDGMVVRRGFPKPKSFHNITLSDHDIERAIVDGSGAMQPMGGRIDSDDRRAIAAYIRALQLSQRARVDAVPANERSALERSGDR